jgi:hypothetical protein
LVGCEHLWKCITSAYVRARRVLYSQAGNRGNVSSRRPIAYSTHYIDYTQKGRNPLGSRDMGTKPSNFNFQLSNLSPDHGRRTTCCCHGTWKNTRQYLLRTELRSILVQLISFRGNHHSPALCASSESLVDLNGANVPQTRELECIELE